MKREEKYPNTDTFTYYNANPHGRITTDCVVRAISTATDIPYNDVVMALAKIQCETGLDDGDKKTIDQYMQSIGWGKSRQPRKADNTKYTGKEFCRLHKKGKYLANIGGHHIVAIVNGKVLDTWDSTNGCIGNYWGEPIRVNI